MLKLSEAPTANERALASLTRERFTGLVTAVVTCSYPVQSGTELVFKNGSLVDPDSYTVSNTTITLGGALIAGDIVVVLYHARLS